MNKWGLHLILIPVRQYLKMIYTVFVQFFLRPIFQKVVKLWNGLVYVISSRNIVLSSNNVKQYWMFNYYFITMNVRLLKPYINNITIIMFTIIRGSMNVLLLTAGTKLREQVFPYYYTNRN